MTERKVVWIILVNCRQGEEKSENFANIIYEWPVIWKLAWPYRVENNDLQAEEK